MKKERRSGGAGKQQYHTDTDKKYLYFPDNLYHGVPCCIILGVTSVREFALPLMVGIVCGAYSSVCITGALWFVMKKKQEKAGAKKA